ncbi:MAG: GntR family transcriptional regulator [Rhodoglobus sp.]|nr:GntR family transcriptional regulator [Rhodoglobus sp.]
MVARRESSRQTQADRVYELLVGKFMDGTWTAGEQLSIPMLSRIFDVSQTPIREALARFEHTGLVRREALKGYSVAPLFSEQDLLKLMEARLVLEPAITTEAAWRVTPEFLEQLFGTIERLTAASESEGIEAFHDYWSADEDFHGLIAKQSANPFLEDAYRSLGGQVQRFRLFAKLGSTDASFAAKEHRAIYDALEARDADAAVARMREHVLNAKSRALSDRKSIAAV